MILALLFACFGGSKDEDGGDDGGIFDTPTGTTQVDLLLVADASSSMSDENLEVGLAMDSLYNAYEAAGVELRVGVVTSDLSGVGGLLLSPPGDAADARTAILCQATCWSESSIPSDPDYQCGDPLGAMVSYEYLDCTCGAGEWQDRCGGGNEEPLEAALVGMCAGAAEPPEVCYDESGAFSEALVGAGNGFPSPERHLHVVVVSDEGDGSRRISQGDEDPSPYADAFDALSDHWAFSAMSADWSAEDGEFPCNAGNATAWGVERYQTLADGSGGIYAPITEGSECELADLEAFFDELGGVSSR